MADKKKTDGKIIAVNRKARHDYFVEDTFEAGLSLFGTEVKSLRQGGVNLKDSYCFIEKGEIFVSGMHISPYEQGKVIRQTRDRDHVRNYVERQHEIAKSSINLGLVPSGDSLALEHIIRKQHMICQPS